MRGSWMLAVVVLSLLPGLARAAWPGVPGRTTAAAPAPEAPTLTPAEMLARSGEAIDRIAQVVVQLGEEFEDARKSRDVILANCVGELNSQAKALLDAGRKSVAELEEAAASHDADGAARAHARVTAIRKRVEQLREVSSECVGEDLGSDRPTGASLITAPKYDDLTEPGVPAPPSTRPPPASPTK